MGNIVATQFVRHDLPGFTMIVSQQPLEKAFSSLTAPAGL